jgi:hypothetical protein
VTLRPASGILSRIVIALGAGMVGSFILALVSDTYDAVWFWSGTAAISIVLLLAMARAPTRAASPASRR